MILRQAFTVSLILCASLVLAACGSSDSGSSDSGSSDKNAIDGSWKGTLKGSGDSTFQAYVELDTLRTGSVSGTVFFPGLDGAGACSGALIYNGKSGSDYRFTEKIVASDNPQCIKLGKVTISAANDGEAIDYSWKSGKDNAAGQLQEWDD